MRNKWMIIMAALVLVACNDDEKESESNQSRSAAMEVDYVVVSPRDIVDEISVTGTLMPSESAMLSAQTAGLIREINFTEGQKVNKGKVLVRLDDRQWIAQRDKLETELANAEKDKKRKEQLSKIEGVSDAELDDAVLQVESIKADLKELEVLIDYSTITAPFTGVIGLRSVSPGSYLAAGAPVAKLVQTDPLKLDFNIPEKYAGKVREGQAVRFTTSRGDSLFVGSVYATEPAITESSRALRVRARVPNKEGNLMAGAFAEINLTLDSIPNALLVPTEALVPKLNEQIVYRINNGTIEEVTVQQGIRLPKLIQINEGLSPGDTIMVKGLLQAEAGKSVSAGKEISVDKLEEER
ncbi:MAG TPA: efflux RND transporter periplasmic adaptor subunit [Cryomorphaceae bacterium]|nr:efflux RND transporter periplasmic adaptor subunit [Cryomorphaceae bacterium]